MPLNLSIENIPDDLVEKLRQRAKRHHRSVPEELMAILEQALAPRRLTLEQLAQRVRERGVRTGDESVAMVREDRDAR